MNTERESGYNRGVGNAIPREAYFYPRRLSRGFEMDLRCPNCDSSDLKKVSLVYQEGLVRARATTRVRAWLLGDDGPQMIAGAAKTNGVLQMSVSENLAPPTKWSYRKLILWSALFSFGLLIAYVHSVMQSSRAASSLPVIIYAGLFPVVFAVCMFLVWRHNSLFYPREFERWNRSYVCRRCGAVADPGPSLQ
jgi:DNA-directed RNA polymerase subunit RPC12/RpoP